VLLTLAALALPGTLAAQNYSWDARSIGMGGVTGVGQGNLAAEFVPRDRGYTSIVIPIGLVQVLSNLDAFDPDNPGFDVLRIIDYAGNPFHYTFNRASREGDVDFLQNIIDSGFSRDLNDYRGFAPPEHLVAGGVMSPNWGYTFKFLRGANDSFQGIYVGAGPHITLQTDMHFDPNLIAILSSPTPVAVTPNTAFFANNKASQQAAVAITGGYRTKIAFDTSTSVRDGIYLSANFTYLHGFRHDAGDFTLNIATDSAGLVTLTPVDVPLTLDHLSANSGRGFTTDVGAVVIRNGWEVGLGINGLANRMMWNDFDNTRYTLSALTTGVDFIEAALPLPAADLRLEVPLEYLANLGYHTEGWTLRTDWSYDAQKLGARAGGEYRFGGLAVRGGLRYSTKVFNPTGGFGFNFTRRLGLDVAFFGNSVNLEQKRNLSMALSLRIEDRTEQ
jgi:hypothetical protein